MELAIGGGGAQEISPKFVRTLLNKKWTSGGGDFPPICPLPTYASVLILLNEIPFRSLNKVCRCKFLQTVDTRREPHPGLPPGPPGPGGGRRVLRHRVQAGAGLRGDAGRAGDGEDEGAEVRGEAGALQGVEI